MTILFIKIFIQNACADSDNLVSVCVCGGGGGGRGVLTTFWHQSINQRDSNSTLRTSSRRNRTKGSNCFAKGGRSLPQFLKCVRKPIATGDFRGGGGVRTPCSPPPFGSAHLIQLN